MLPIKKADLTIEVGSRNISCFNLIDGIAWVTASGGTPPYTYLWSNGATTDTIYNLPSNTYTITVEDFVGNKVAAEVYIAEPPLLHSGVLLSNPILDCTTTQLTATATPIGGTPPCTFQWAFPQGVIDTGQTVNIVQPYNYVYTVTDSRGCTFIGDTTIGSQNIPVVFLSLADTVSCNGLHDGSATSSVTGGAPPYTYLWSNGSTNPNLLDVGAGSYSLTVTDTEGCSGQAYVFIPQPGALILSMDGNDVTCFGQTTGAIFTTLTGGSLPYSYLWSNGETTPSLGNIGGGTYTLTVTDAHGCDVVGSVTINQGNEIHIYTNTFPVSCNGGSDGYATVFATGGAGGFQYNWSNGTSGSQATNLKAGTYLVYIIDKNQCVEERTLIITEPPLLEMSLNSTPEILGGSDGTAWADVSGGTTPYTYNWSNGANTAIISGLTAGMYYLTVTDKKGCLKLDSIEVAASNCAFSAKLLTINPTCFGGSDGAIFPEIITPGQEPYYFQWSDDTHDVILDSLKAGKYYVTIYDNANCMLTLSATLINPSRMNVDYILTQPDGPGKPYGSIKVFLNGGAPPYKVSFQGVDYLGGNEILIDNIPPGNYTAYAKDSKGCSTPVDFQINQFECLLTGNVITVDEPDCYGDKNGQLCVMYQNNFGSVSIEWSNGATTACISNLIAGEYAVVLRDTLGCMVVLESTVKQPNFITLENITINPGTNHFDGSISLFVIGGTPPFTYTWTKNGEYFANTRNINQLNEGTYQLSVVDSKGCTALFEAFRLTPSKSFSNYETGIKVYPNPVYENLIVETRNYTVIHSIDYISMNGKKVRLPFTTTEKGAVLGVGTLPQGPFVLSVVTNEGIANVKLVKM
ncbi:MAG: hypothetical protein WA008_07515 [Saprospiraceae bacterium]